MKLVDLVQLIWEHRNIPKEMGWTILILIPKGNPYNQGVGLLEFLWKLMEAIIDTCIKKDVILHDILYGFCVERGIGTDIMDTRLT